MTEPEPLIPKHGGHRKLKSFRTAKLVHDVTALFCERYLDPQSPACEQMMLAAERGAHEIAEGSQASEVSKKTEMKLTGLARDSLDELRRDYEAFLQQHELLLWDAEDPRRAELIARRPTCLQEVMGWVHRVEENNGQDGPHEQDHQKEEQSTQSIQSMSSIHGRPAPHAEAMANGALALINLAFSRLDRQMAAQSRAVDHEARTAERLRRRRLADWPE